MILAPSILAADLADLTTALEQCEAGGADMVHCDVMDGRFVPNLTFGAPVLRAIRRHTELPLDVHLMIAEPDRLLDDVLAAEPAWVSVHVEAAAHLDRLLQRIREGGARAGAALNPATPIEGVEEVLGELDFVLVMSVNPGFAGQRFLPYTLRKAMRLRQIIRDRGVDVTLQMDGGIGPDNVAEVVAGGVEACVAGSAVFAADDPSNEMRRLRGAAGARVS